MATSSCRAMRSVSAQAALCGHTSMANFVLNPDPDLKSFQCKGVDSAFAVIELCRSVHYTSIG